MSNNSAFLIESNRFRASQTRLVRLANYKKLIATMRENALTVEQMANTIKVSRTGVVKYQSAMRRFGLIVRLPERSGMHNNVSLYGLFDEAERIAEFLAFIGGCESIKEEINGKPMSKYDDSDFDRPCAIMKKAVQIGVKRHWMDVALFGPAGKANA